tara:strand:- start:1331 stop:1501 length:171 start_codon:yes stop_codon:yes gene_type:complete
MVVDERWIGNERYKRWGVSKLQEYGDTPEEVAQYIVDNSDDFSDKIIEKAEAVLDL